MTLDTIHWQKRLDELCDKHHVPGATLAVLHNDAISAFASGVVNVESGVETTTDSIFQIGSVSKVYTATMIMQLVDEGKLALDEPVVTYLPDFKVADAELTKTVTVRHLLNHTSGIDGDLFLDLGRGDDVVEKYVEAMADLPKMAPLGTLMSYCNSGFVLSGRLIEVLTDSVWDAALAARLSAPLGLTHTGTLPEEAIRYRAAFGHIVDPETKVATLAPAWQLPRPMGPAGLINSTATDVVRFAKLHMDSGLAHDGARILSESSAAAMRQPEIVIPEPDTLGTHWGLGWILFGQWLKADGTSAQVYGHDGNTIGQSAFLRIAPEAGLAVCLMVNGGASRSLYLELYRELFAELAEIVVPANPEPVETAVNTSEYLGTYERHGMRIEVSDADGALTMAVFETGELKETTDAPLYTLALKPTALEHQFVMLIPGTNDYTPLSFVRLEETGTQYLHFGVRATPKVSA